MNNFIETKSTLAGWFNGSEGGIITSPNYPNEYDDFSYCEWLVSGIPGEQVCICEFYGQGRLIQMSKTQNLLSIYSL